ncbi:MAG: NAD(+)/NADH kinase [Anaerolineae bacterium]|nr:NAD(+)/NADH kinase [Anaerolineae bacterium]
MQATLIYNRNARNIDQISPDDIKAALMDMGFKPVYKSTSSQQDLDPILAETDEGLVIVAGGDGTLRAVATRLIDKDVPIALIPLGTANNISKNLGIYRDPLEILAGLKNPIEFKYDVGYVRGPWGADYFLEGAGFGMFADMLATYDPNKGKSILRSIEAAFKNIVDQKKYFPLISIDGNSFVDSHLLVEVLNTNAVGPRLKFAPEANPGDGFFDVIQVKENENETLLDYAAGLFMENLAEYESVVVSKAKTIEIQWTGFPFHIDGEVRPKQTERPPDQDPAEGVGPITADAGTGNTVSIEILPGALTLWLPQFDDQA